MLVLRDLLLRQSRDIKRPSQIMSRGVRGATGRRRTGIIAFVALAIATALLFGVLLATALQPPIDPPTHTKAAGPYVSAALTAARAHATFAAEAEPLRTAV